MLASRDSDRPATEWAAFPRSVGDPLYGDFAQGEFVRTAAIDDLRLEVTAHPGEALVEPHSHIAPLLLLVLDGAMEDHCEGQMFMATPGTLLVRPANTVHAARMLRPTRLFSIEPGPEWLERVDALRLIHRLVRSEWEGRASLLALKVYTAFARLDTMTTAGLAAQGYTQALLAEVMLSEESAEIPLWLLDTRRHLDANLRQRLDLTALARKAGVHPVHLCRAFRKQFGVTMTDYLREGRLAAATVQLSTTDRPVAEIAKETGFADGSHLAREFRRSVGNTPAGFRGSIRERTSN